MKQIERFVLQDFNYCVIVLDTNVCKPEDLPKEIIPDTKGVIWYRPGKKECDGYMVDVYDFNCADAVCVNFNDEYNKALKSFNKGEICQK